MSSFVYNVQYMFVSSVQPCLFAQGGQKTLEAQEDPETPWILYAPGEMPWKTLKLQPTPEKLYFEADFDASIFGFSVLLHLLFLQRRGGGSMRLLVGKTSISYVVL